MTIINRQALTAVLLAASFSLSLAARQLGLVGWGGAGSGLDALLLLGAVCFGCAAAVLLWMRRSGRR